MMFFFSHMSHKVADLNQYTNHTTLVSSQKAVSHQYDIYPLPCDYSCHLRSYSLVRPLTSL